MQQQWSLGELDYDDAWVGFVDCEVGLPDCAEVGQAVFEEEEFNVQCFGKESAASAKFAPSDYGGGHCFTSCEQRLAAKVNVICPSCP